MREFVFGGMLLLCGVTVAGQAPADEVPLARKVNAAALANADMVLFDMQRPEMTPSHWGFEINKDGVGRYYVAGEKTEANPSGNTWWNVSVSQTTLNALLAGQAQVAAERGCETKAKHIAQTGKKKLSYVRGIALTSCEFNYSDDDHVNAAATAFQTVAETMQAGERLKHKHRFDHLGLDAELDVLVTQAKDKRAVEFQNIAAVLQSIVNDEELMSPSRRKAQSLLKMGSQAPAASAR